MAALLLSGAAALAVRRWERGNRFLNEVVVELGKVTWPVRKAVVSSSGVVVVLVAIAGVLLTLMDLIWARVAQGVLF